jgi:hypothetical protein
MTVEHHPGTQSVSGGGVIDDLSRFSVAIAISVQR